LQLLENIVNYTNNIKKRNLTNSTHSSILFGDGVKYGKVQARTFGPSTVRSEGKREARLWLSRSKDEEVVGLPEVEP
jgi:hypothetical protein